MAKKKIRWDRIFLVALAIVAVVVLVWQLQSNGTPQVPNNNQTNTQQSLIEDNEVYLTIGSRNYTYGELNAQYMALDAQTRSVYTLDEFVEAGIVPVQLLLREAESKSITVNDSLVEEQVEFITEMAQSQGMTFEQYVQEFGFSEEQAKQKIREDLVIQELLDNAIGENITIQESELIELYEMWNIAEQNLTLEEVRSDLEEMVRAEKYNVLVGEYIANLRNSTAVTYHFAAGNETSETEEPVIIVNQTTQTQTQAINLSNSEIKEFKLTGHMFYFADEEGNKNPDIIVNVGDRVRLVFDNVEGVHDWIVDEIEGAFTNLLQPGQSQTIEFTASEAGEFEYYCSYMQHRAQGMFGKIIVQ
jgi:plastocyanin